MSNKKLTSFQVMKISETLEDFKALLPRYRKCREDESGELLHRFCSRNRNPLFDITSIDYSNLPKIKNPICRNKRGQLVKKTLRIQVLFENL